MLFVAEAAVVINARMIAMIVMVAAGVFLALSFFHPHATKTKVLTLLFLFSAGGVVATTIRGVAIERVSF